MLEHVRKAADFPSKFRTTRIEMDKRFRLFLLLPGAYRFDLSRESFLCVKIRMIVAQRAIQIQRLALSAAAVFGPWPLVGGFEELELLPDPFEPPGLLPESLGLLPESDLSLLEPEEVSELSSPGSIVGLY